MDNINDLMFLGGSEMSSVAIKGGSSGIEAAVNAQNQLSVTPSAGYYRAMLAGDAYLWLNATADIDATDTMILLRNDSADRLLVIEAISVLNGNVGATTYDIHLVTAAFTAAGTAVTGINMLAGGGAPPGSDYTCMADETGNTKGTMLGHLITTTASIYYPLTQAELPCLGRLALGNGTAIGIDQITESTAGVGLIWGYFVDR
jgi:hypothetical protein